MSIINWNEEVASNLDDKIAKEIFLSLLKRKITEKWNGFIIHKRKASIDFHAPYIELRKHLGDAQVLIRIGRRAPSQHWMRQPVPEGVTSQLSMNAKADFVQDDYVELNLVITEAFAVFDSLENIDTEEI